MNDRCGVNSIELVSLIVAGACHDFEHPGFSNPYLIEARDPIAVKYNGMSETSYLLLFRCVCP